MDSVGISHLSLKVSFFMKNLFSNVSTKETDMSLSMPTQIAGKFYLIFQPMYPIGFKLNQAQW